MDRNEKTAIALVGSAAERIREAIYDLEWAIEKLGDVRYYSTRLEDTKESLYNLYGRLTVETKENEVK